jgi:hypothetical protein
MNKIREDLYNGINHKTAEHIPTSGGCHPSSYQVEFKIRLIRNLLHRYVADLLLVWFATETSENCETETRYFFRCCWRPLEEALDG